MDEKRLRAIYFPYSRTLDEVTLKRAVLLYDEILFVDPKTPKVRAGLYDVAQHQQYLPDDAAEALANEWSRISERYSVLEDAELLRFVDPSPVLEQQAVDELITGHLQADMLDQQVIDLFADHAPTWSMLRSRIPSSALQFLSHQYTPRVLYDENVHRPFDVIDGQGYALFADGKPDQGFSLPGWQEGRARPDDREWAAVVPFYLGSSIATSTALAVAVDTGAVPLTDSDAHFRLLSARFVRAAAKPTPVSDMPGLTATFSPAAAQKRALVEQRLVDSVLSRQDLESLSLVDVLRYRDETTEERQQYRTHVAEIVHRIRSQPWSPEVEAEIEGELRAAEKAMQARSTAMKTIYTKLFKRTAIGLAVSSTPVLLTALFPGVSALWALLLGSGTLSGVLAEPIKELASTWSDRQPDESGLAYLMGVKEGLEP